MLIARRFLSSMTCVALCSHAATANANGDQSPTAITTPTCMAATERCIAPEDRINNINELPITIEADRVEAQTNDKSLYTGDVVIKQGYRLLRADKIELTAPNDDLVAEGNVYLYDGDLILSSTKLQSNLATEASTLENATYNLMCTDGRGEAKRVFKNGTTFYLLEDGTYTTCPDGDNSWRFSAGRIEKQDGDIFADLYNARFEVLGAPILYLPYLRVPVESGRLTGFLYPSFSVNDTDGITVDTPFYWNIAPQADVTITPTYMSKRGMFLSVEPRYLTDLGSGSLTLEYMGKDRQYEEFTKSWGVNWRHYGVDNHWKYSANYSKVSDVDYFNRHPDSTIGNREENTLLQTGEVSYRTDAWTTELTVRDFQPLSNDISVYRLLPQLSFNYYQPEADLGLEFYFPAQISNFTTDGLNKPDAIRVNMAPTLIVPYNSPALTATAEAKLFVTYYDQSNIENVIGYNGERLSDYITRTVPMVRLHSGVTLEREGSIWGNGYTQTLEPQLQYLYIRDVDQSGIYNPVNYAGGGYDTARLQTDYHGLFRANQFTSIDYINPANQFTLGASTRFFDEGYKERFNLSFGQIYYIERPTIFNDLSVNYSAWAVESELNVFDRLFVRGSLEYDSNLNDIQFGNAVVEYRDNQWFAQASYRFVSRDYIAGAIGVQNLDLITKDGISQVGLITSFPITDKIRAQGQYFQDLTQNLLIENQFGITYRSECWVIGFSYNKYLLARNNINESAIYDNNVTLSFSLLGLGANAGFGNTANGNALGYINPFGLKN